MGTRTRPRSSLFAAALMVAATTGPTNAQAEVDEETPAPSPTAAPGLAEVALCQMPELGEKAGSLGPLVASIAGVAAPGPRSAQGPGALMPTGSAGCMPPTVEIPDQLDSGGPILMYALNDLVGDGPVDIRRVLSTKRELGAAEAGARRSAKGTVIVGKAAKAIPAGDVYLICVDQESVDSIGRFDDLSVARTVRGNPIPSCLSVAALRLDVVGGRHQAQRPSGLASGALLSAHSGKPGITGSASAAHPAFANARTRFAYAHPAFSYAHSRSASPDPAKHVWT